MCLIRMSGSRPWMPVDWQWHMKRLALALFALGMTACAVRSPVHYSVNIELDRDPSRVRVTAVTQLERFPGDDAVRERLRPLRDALAAERDDWSQRFHGVDLDYERVTVERNYGEITRVEHTGVMDRGQLQRFFGDLPLTVAITNVDGTSELAIYPGSSSRATREQQEIVQNALSDWSGDLAQYLNRMSHLYAWLDTHPQAATRDFTLLFEDPEKAHALDPEEDALVTGARTAMAQVTDRLELKKGEAVPIDELFDLVYNPFPAEITIRTPHAFSANENFQRRAGDVVAIPHAGLLDAARSLEGKWLSPDPLAMLLRSEEEKFEMPKPHELALMKRKWSADVSAEDIQAALVDAVKPAADYRVRWAERVPDPAD